MMGDEIVDNGETSKTGEGGRESRLKYEMTKYRHDCQNTQRWELTVDFYRWLYLEVFVFVWRE